MPDHRSDAARPLGEAGLPREASTLWPLIAGLRPTLLIVCAGPTAAFHGIDFVEIEPPWLTVAGSFPLDTDDRAIVVFADGSDRFVVIEAAVVAAAQQSLVLRANAAEAIGHDGRSCRVSFGESARSRH
jgi:hypothetical protein